MSIRFYFLFYFYSRSTSINDPPTQSITHYPMYIHIVIIIIIIIIITINITLDIIRWICVTRYLLFICVQNIPKLYTSYNIQTYKYTIHTRCILYYYYYYYYA